VDDKLAGGQIECEFWNSQIGDCRIRKILELLEKLLTEFLNASLPSKNQALLRNNP